MTVLSKIFVQGVRFELTNGLTDMVLSLTRNLGSFFMPL